MGCCLTTAAGPGKTKHGRPENSKPKSESPPPAVEEETVKEVLSETPIVPKTPPPPSKPPQSEELKTENDVVALVKKKNPTEEIHESVSEVSEMYSYSESFSAATTATAAESKLDDVVIEIDDDEVTQKVKDSSPPAKRVLRKRRVVYSGELPRRKERDRGVRAPARRTAVPSPEKKCQTSSRTMTTGRHRNVGPSNDARKEIPARRSRSPAVRGDAGQRRKVRERSPAEKSGDRKQVNAGENEGRSTVEKAGDGGVSPEPQTSESLENPLVSLECFIFL